MYQDPNTIEHVQAPTGDMYAIPETKGSKRRPPPTQPAHEVPTYQDPNTIQRHQAPTGDIYTLPEKKPVYSKVNKQAKVSYSITNYIIVTVYVQVHGIWFSIKNIRAQFNSCTRPCRVITFEYFQNHNVILLAPTPGLIINLYLIWNWLLSALQKSLPYLVIT